ncbi:uncharacterized protein KZ484_005042 isoform 1-T2 [Pholidichthys leucotaenia]
MATVEADGRQSGVDPTTEDESHCRLTICCSGTSSTSSCFSVRQDSMKQEQVKWTPDQEQECGSSRVNQEGEEVKVTREAQEAHITSIPPPLQVLFHLLPTLTTDHNVVCKHHGPRSLLPDLVCQPVHHHANQEGAQS